MNNIKSILAFVGFLTILKTLISLIPQPEGTVCVIHEEVEIEFIEDATAMNEYEYETLSLRAER